MNTKMLLKIADRLDKRAEAIFNNLFRQHERERELAEKCGEDFNTPWPKSQMAGALRIFAEELREVLGPVSFRNYEGKGDLFTIEEFESSVEVGAFIDSDGYGYYAKKHPGKSNDTILESGLPAVPSRIAGGDVNKKFTHVCWYNK